MKSWPPSACFYLNSFRRENKMKFTYAYEKSRKMRNFHIGRKKCSNSIANISPARAQKVKNQISVERSCKYEALAAYRMLLSQFV